MSFLGFAASMSGRMSFRILDELNDSRRRIPGPFPKKEIRRWRSLALFIAPYPEQGHLATMAINREYESWRALLRQSGYVVKGGLFCYASAMFNADSSLI
jgi:hypothetical protein